MPTWPRAVLFDFDGVLVNSEPLHFFALNEVLKAEHVELTEDEYYRDLIGFDDRGAIRHLFQKRNLPLEPKTLLSLMARKSRVMMDLIHRRAVPRPARRGGVRPHACGARCRWRSAPAGCARRSRRCSRASPCATASR